MRLLNEFAYEVHKNAVEHGWWEEERTFGEIAALIHSELSEALEEYRAKRPMLWYETWRNGKGESFVANEKPEGIAVELADCIIRILDWFGHEELDADLMMQRARRYVFAGEAPRLGGGNSLPGLIARWHLLVSMAYRANLVHGSWEAGLRLARCVNEILDWAEAEEGVDMDMLLDLKHAYNKGRPYRHGGKAL